MKKTKRILKKYWVLLTLFLLMNMFLMSIIIQIFKYEKDLKVTNSLIGENAKKILFQTQNEIKAVDLINMINNKKVILESDLFINNDELETNVIGIYYNYDISKKYPLISGRMFNLSEIDSGEKVALVGYNLKNNIKNGFVKIHNDKYKVIGLLGDKSNTSLDNSIYINLNSENLNLSGKYVTIDIKDSSITQTINKINDDLNKTKHVNIDIREPAGNIHPLREAIDSSIYYLIIGFLALLCLVSTVINISSYWIEGEKKIIAIKSLVGQNKKLIILQSYIEYQSIVVISGILSYLIWIVFSINKTIDFSIVFKGLIVILIIDMLMSTVAFIPTIIKVCRMNINIIIKENI